jgi:endonuclease/exonuclease/phosphatase family metal-dependent hydrolase
VRHNLSKPILTGLTVLTLIYLLIRVLAFLCPLPGWIHDPLIYFPLPLSGIFAAILFLVAWRKQAVRSRLLLAALAAFLGNVCIDCRLVPAEARRVPSGRQFHLLSYNLFATRWADDDFLSFIRSHHPDVLLLQEVPPAFFKRHEEEFRQLFRHVRYSGELLTAANLDVSESESIPLRGGRTLHRLVVCDARGSFEVYNTHLTVVHPLRFYQRLAVQRGQTEEILAYLKQTGRPFVLGGDFNFPIGATCYRAFTSTCREARSAAIPGPALTYPSPLPVTGIDHVFGSREVCFMEFRPERVYLSDHRPVHCRFTLPEARTERRAEGGGPP